MKKINPIWWLLLATTPILINLLLPLINLNLGLEFSLLKWMLLPLGLVMYFFTSSLRKQDTTITPPSSTEKNITVVLLIFFMITGIIAVYIVYTISIDLIHLDNDQHYR